MSAPSNSPDMQVNVLWADPVRQGQFHTWLTGLTAAQGLRPETLRIASADASFRRYLRVDTVSGDSRIIMDAPPDKENSKPFVQIAGLIARRIVGFCQQGDALEAGERFGLIRFGSRVDVYLPEGVTPLVGVGQTTIAGETVIAQAGVGKRPHFSAA